MTDSIALILESADNESGSVREVRTDSMGVSELGAEDDVRNLLGVARLGESDLAGWWGTQLYSQAGRYVLSRSFPQTWKPAAGQLLMLSCYRWHNHAFSGRPTAIHLFSSQLPALGWAQSWLAEQKTTKPADPLFDELAGWSNKGDAADAIARWLPDRPFESELVAGNLRLGTVEAGRLHDPAEVAVLVSQLAKAYLTGNDTLQIPYFDAV